MQAVNDKTRKILINIAGFGLGILWVVKDEMENPRIFRIPKAESFENEAVIKWNESTGPKGQWAVTDAEISRMNAHFSTPVDQGVDIRSSTW